MEKIRKIPPGSPVFDIARQGEAVMGGLNADLMGTAAVEPYQGETMIIGAGYADDIQRGGLGLSGRRFRSVGRQHAAPHVGAAEQPVFPAVPACDSSLQQCQVGLVDFPGFEGGAEPDGPLQAL